MKYKKEIVEQYSVTWPEGKALSIAKTVSADPNSSDVSGWEKKSTFTDAVTRGLLKSVLTGLNTAIGFDETTCRTIVQKSAIASETYQVQEGRQAVLRMYSVLAHLSGYQLVAGDRMVLIKSLVEDMAGSVEYAKAIPRALAVNTKRVGQEAKAALLRYLALHESSLSNSQLTSIFLSAAQSDEDVSALAAARALDDVADEGAVSSIAVMLPKVRSQAARLIMMSTMERLNRGGDDGAIGTDA